MSTLIVFSFSLPLSISVRQFMSGILQARSGLNSLIWASPRVPPCQRRLFFFPEDIAGRIDRCCLFLLVNSLSGKRVRSPCALSGGEIDFCVHLVCPSLCVFQAQFRKGLWCIWRGRRQLPREKRCTRAQKNTPCVGLTFGWLPSFFFFPRRRREGGGVVGVQGTSSSWGGGGRRLAQMRLVFGSQTSDCSGTN